MITVWIACLYGAVLYHPFVNYDDGEYVFKNEHVNTGLTAANARWALTGMAVGNWHPLTWMSHQLDCQLFGLNAGGHHLTSILLHMLNAILLFLLLARGTGKQMRSAIVALLFALHPLNVESVAWIAERKNVLCTLFFFLAIAAYGYYVRRPSLGRYLAVAALFVMGAASKPMVVTLPFVLLLLDYWPLSRIDKWCEPSSAFSVKQVSPWKLVLEKAPLFALSAVSCVVTVVAQKKVDAIPDASLWTLSWSLANAVWGYTAYLLKAFFPLHLAPFYPVAWRAPWKLWLLAVLLFAIGIALAKFRARYPYLAAGYLWFLGTLVPVIGIVQVGSQSMADRYTYIPMLGIFVLSVWGIADWFEKRKWNTRALVPLTGIVLVALSILTWRQVGYWKSSYDLWAHDLQVTGSNYVAEENLAIALADLGRDDEALPHFQNALEIRPDDAVALLNIGTNLSRHGRQRESIPYFEAVLGVSKDAPQLTAAHRGLGVAYAGLGDRAQARLEFLRALQLSPDETSEVYNLSMLEVEDGVDRLSKALAAHPSAKGYVDLGRLLQQDQKPADAKHAFEKALALDPNFSDATQALQELSGPQTLSAQ